MNGFNNQLFYGANILGGASQRPSLQNVPNRQAPRSFPTMPMGNSFLPCQQPIRPSIQQHVTYQSTQPPLNLRQRIQNQARDVPPANPMTMHIMTLPQQQQNVFRPPFSSQIHAPLVPNLQPFNPFISPYLPAIPMHPIAANTQATPPEDNVQCQVQQTTQTQQADSVPDKQRRNLMQWYNFGQEFVQATQRRMQNTGHSSRPRNPLTPITTNGRANARPLPTNQGKKYNPVSKKELKGLLHCYFAGEQLESGARWVCTSSLRAFCKDKGVSDSVRQQMWYMIGKHERLKELEGSREDEEKRNEAIDIIDQILPGPNYRQSAASLPSRRQRNDNFFTPQNVAEIAQSLDFSAEPRMSRGGDVEIKLNKLKDPNERARSLILFWYNGIVSRQSNLSRSQKEAVLENVAKVVMYDQGYKEAKRFKNLLKTWEPRLVEYFKTGSGPAPLRSRNKGRRAYTDQIEVQHPFYIHQLYRAAEKKIGTQASFKKMAQVMNTISRTTQFDHKPDLNLKESHLRRHFFQFKGTMKSPLEKPYKTDDQKKQTLEWVRKTKTIKRRLKKKFHACFIDEKWFYTQSRRKKSKHLPPHPDFETEEDVPEFVRTTVSRRHPIKVIGI
jgi:hypothetical protein